MDKELIVSRDEIVDILTRLDNIEEYGGEELCHDRGLSGELRGISLMAQYIIGDITKNEVFDEFSSIEETARESSKRQYELDMRPEAI